MKIAGFSLVEMMVALTISLILSALLLNHYVDANGALSMQTSMYHLQEVVNISNDVITQEIQQAGYIGCAKLAPGFPIRHYQQYSLTYANQLMVTGESIISRHASSLHAALLSISADKKSLYVSDNISFKPNDILIISDCQHAEIFKVKNIFHLNQQIKVETIAPLDGDFSVNTEVAYFESNRLFLKKLSKNKKALFIEDVNLFHRQITEGVEALHFANKLHGVTFTETVTVNALQKEWGGYVPIS